ncbi:MAG: imidazole glycerol phosphate synthase subunit HisH [Verrucomicrobiota bacterium]
MKVAVIDYGMGNLRSVGKAFEAVGGEVSVVESPCPEGNLDALVLPGVGALGDCVDALRETGMDEWIRNWIKEDRPFFGICLGFQALFDHSEEGNVKGLGIFSGRVERFRINPSLKVPHMGWNSVRFLQKDDPFQKHLCSGDQFYFDHTYCVVPDEKKWIWCSTDYGGEFASGIASGNCVATQFHPEKSQAKGLQIYRNFLNHAGSNSGVCS